MKGSLLKQICAEYTLADEVKAMGIYPYYRPIESGQDPVVKMNGKDVSISNNAGTSTRWLTSGNYLVVKNIALSYSLPKRWLTPLQVQGLSVSVACENLFTFAARKGLNPQYSFGGSTSSNKVRS